MGKLQDQNDAVPIVSLSVARLLHTDCPCQFFSAACSCFCTIYNVIDGLKLAQNCYDLTSQVIFLVLYASK